MAHRKQHGPHRYRRAAFIEGFGGNEQVKVGSDWPVAEPGEGEVLVRVSSAGSTLMTTPTPLRID